MEKKEANKDNSNNAPNNNPQQNKIEDIPYRGTKISEFLKAKKNANFDIDLSSLSQKTFTSLIGDSKKYQNLQKIEDAKKLNNQNEIPKKNNNSDIKVPDKERKRKYRLHTNDVKLPSNINLLKKLCEKMNKNDKESNQPIFKFEEDDNVANPINNINNNNDKKQDKKIPNNNNNNKKNEVFSHKKTSSQNLSKFKPNFGNDLENASHKKSSKKLEVDVECKNLTYADSINGINPKIPNNYQHQNKYQNINDNYYNKNQNNMNMPIENEIVKNDYYIKLNYMNIEYSFMENQNIQFENTMEDRSKSLINFNNNPNEILLEVFDGHGGGDVSTYLQKNFSKVYKRYLNETQNNIAKSFSMAFNQVDEDIRQTQVENQGSTGTIIHILRENNNRLFVFNGNVGDSRVSLISPKKIIRLSQDHRTTDNEERKRVISEGGMVFNNRVNGELMLTRSFGDFDFKSNGKHKTKKIKDELSKFRRGVICEPFVTQIEIDQSIKNQFLFLGSDGIWDVISEEEMQQLIKVNNDTKYLSSIIIEKALFKQAWDNLSVFVVKLT